MSEPIFYPNQIVVIDKGRRKGTVCSVGRVFEGDDGDWMYQLLPENDEGRGKPVTIPENQIRAAEEWNPRRMS